MNARANVQITIEYSKVGEAEPLKRSLAADEYFEVPPDGSAINMDSVPRYNHGIDYLELDPHEARVVRLVISSLLDGSSRTIIETFWSGGKCRMIERTDTGAHPYWELIVESRIVDQPPSWDILRLIRNEGVLVPVYHAVIRDNADGSQTESLILSETLP